MKRLTNLGNFIKNPIVLITLAALLLALPQLITGNMIVGSDAVFHFNRFYDTAEQIKTGNFQYFITMYGFQSSGRIVNALYGPLVAYFHGLLVLMSSSWFSYQVLANLVIHLLAGLSMYALLRKLKISPSFQSSLSIIFMTSYPVNYWVTRQGFSSWGAALMPLCLLPVVDMLQKKNIQPLTLGALMALMFQTHLLSSVMLAAIYVPFFIYAFCQTSDKKQLVKNLAFSILIFFVLTINIWLTFLSVYQVNEILPPFKNRHMYTSTLDKNSYYWIIDPPAIALLIILQGVLTFHWWKKLKTGVKLFTFSAFAFFLFATNVVPWRWLVQHKFTIVETIQFPFRFVIPATVLLLGAVGLTLQRVVAKKWPHLVLGVVALIGLVGFSFMTTQMLQRWNHVTNYMALGPHAKVVPLSSNEIKDSFYDRDRTKTLQLVEKATPDYLPVYQELPQNSYDEYAETILKKEQAFTKEVQQHQLVVTWQASSKETLQVPIIKYQDTQLTLNGQKLRAKDYHLTSLGAVLVTPQVGANKLVVTYQPPAYFYPALWLMLLCWGIVSVWQLVKRPILVDLTVKKA